MVECLSVCLWEGEEQERFARNQLNRRVRWGKPQQQLILWRFQSLFSRQGEQKEIASGRGLLSCYIDQETMR